MSESEKETFRPGGGGGDKGFGTQGKGGKPHFFRYVFPTSIKNLFLGWGGGGGGGGCGGLFIDMVCTAHINE